MEPMPARLPKQRKVKHDNTRPDPQRPGLEKNISQALRFYRLKKGLTQAALGLKLGYDEDAAQSRISKYEKGNRSPNKRTLGRIASILEVPVEALTNKPGDSLSANEQHLLSIYRGIKALSPERASEQLRFLEFLLKLLTQETQENQ